METCDVSTDVLADWLVVSVSGVSIVGLSVVGDCVDVDGDWVELCDVITVVLRVVGDWLDIIEPIVGTFTVVKDWVVSCDVIKAVVFDWMEIDDVMTVVHQSVERDCAVVGTAVSVVDDCVDC